MGMLYPYYGKHVDTFTHTTCKSHPWYGLLSNILAIVWVNLKQAVPMLWVEVPIVWLCYP